MVTCYVRLLIGFVESNDPLTWKGVVLAFALLLSCVFSALFIHMYLYFAWISGMRVRTIVNAAVYRKVNIVLDLCGPKQLLQD